MLTVIYIASSYISVGLIEKDFHNGYYTVRRKVNSIVLVPRQDLDSKYRMSLFSLFCVCSVRLEVIVRFVDSWRIVDHHCLNFFLS